MKTQRVNSIQAQSLLGVAVYFKSVKISECVCGIWSQADSRKRASIILQNWLIWMSTQN